MHKYIHTRPPLNKRIGGNTNKDIHVQRPRNTPMGDNMQTAKKHCTLCLIKTWCRLFAISSSTVK